MPLVLIFPPEEAPSSNTSGKSERSSAYNAVFCRRDGGAKTRSRCGRIACSSVSVPGGGKVLKHCWAIFILDDQWRDAFILG